MTTAGLETTEDGKHNSPGRLIDGTGDPHTTFLQSITNSALATLKNNYARDLLAPVGFVLVNAVTFLIIQPGVNDLWAARSRADAVGNGAGLRNWFAWFSGGSTPASYSILSPWVTWLITPELGLALCAVVTMVLLVILLRQSRHPISASALAAVGICANLWSGRVPFVMAAAFAAGSLLAVHYRRPVAASISAVLSLLFSPVTAAFLGIGLAALVLTKLDLDAMKRDVDAMKDKLRTDDSYQVKSEVRHNRFEGVHIGRFFLIILGRQVDRHLFVLPAVCLLVGGVSIALIYGAPGPEPVSFGVASGMIATHIGCLLASRSWSVRVTLYFSLAVTILIILFPNGMGTNYTRFVWYCLPVIIVALNEGRRQLVAIAAIALTIIGCIGTARDLHQAAQPAAAVSYYDPLITALVAYSELPGNPDLRNYRVELVEDGYHTGAFAMLNHAQLARGWETQSDEELNQQLRPNAEGSLISSSYKSWLKSNSVAYVALNLHPLNPAKPTPEAILVRSQPNYLHAIWQDPNSNWILYQIDQPQSIVETPVPNGHQPMRTSDGRAPHAYITELTQGSLTLKVNCACTFLIHIYWNRGLQFVSTTPASTPTGTATPTRTPAIITSAGDPQIASPSDTGTKSVSSASQTPSPTATVGPATSTSPVPSPSPTSHLQPHVNPPWSLITTYAPGTYTLS